MDFVSKARKLERRISRTVDAAVVEFVGRSATRQSRWCMACSSAPKRKSRRSVEDGACFRSTASAVHVAVDLATRSRAHGMQRSLMVRRRCRSVWSSGSSIRWMFDRANRDDVVLRSASRVQTGQMRISTSNSIVSTSAADAMAAPRRATGRCHRLKLTIVKGAAEQRSYAFTTGRIDIGRRSDVVDQRQRLIRTNHVAFSEDGPDENRTVSRRHAHIEFSEQDRCYRLWDDRSAHGTAIIRHGRSIRVPPGARGMRLETDDEIVLGQARIRVEMRS